MERESLLTMLTILLGGVALQVIGAWLSTRSHTMRGFGLWKGGRRTALVSPELSCWLRLWQPLVAPVIVASGLLGWALSEPDPVPDHVGPLVFVVCAPFALLGLRAVFRALWSLLAGPGHLGIATVGLLRPRIVFSPELAALLDEPAKQAALAHERAHVRHLDPLRIWLAQFATDLQWPWACAQRRFDAWLAALEHARDDEARAEGIEGCDLAAALVASARFNQNIIAGPYARLTGDRSVIEERVQRLLQPAEAPTNARTPTRVLLYLTLAVTLALSLGMVYGESLVGALLAFFN
jgi:hypothetical protein